MKIKCPECELAYNVPEDKIGDQPRKMRCKNCDTIFTIARRTSIIPSGYKQFNVEQSLPDEFSFLKEATQKNKAIDPDTLAEEPAGRPSPPMAVVHPATPSAPPAADVAPAPPDNRVADRSTPTPAQALAPETPAAPAPTPTPTRQSPPPPANDPYGSSSPAWEQQQPLDLGAFQVTQAVPQNQQTGKIVGGIAALVILFFVFVAFRNGWDLSLPNLADQVAFAFSSGSYEALPEETESIETTISNRRLLAGADNRGFLIVEGEVFNNAAASRSHVVLRGRLFDKHNDVRGETKAPCGRSLDDAQVKTLQKGSLNGHYRPGGELYNCALKANGAGAYQLIFDDLPLDYDSSFTVEVQAVLARYPGAS